MALFNRKNKEDKKHKGENIIGKIIYGFLLFAPLLAILSTSLYAIFNKNAFESYYGETINERIDEKIDYTNLKINDNYYFKNPINDNKTNEYGNDNRIYVENTNNINGFGNNVDLSDTYYIRLYMNNTYNALQFFDSSNNQLASYNMLNTVCEFSFTYLGITGNTAALSYYNYFYQITYNKYSYLDNNFDYGIYKTEQNNLFNWSKQTGTYTILQTTCTEIGITNTFIPMLMSYWLLISVIYFLFDIALILVWAVHDKIHELKDSI